MRKKTTLEKKQLIVKSNDLIEARYRLSIQESRVILWLLTQIRPEDEDFKEHTISVKEFSKVIEVDLDEQYRSLREITKNLIKRGMEIYEPKIKQRIQVAWLSSAIYYENEGRVSLKFDPALKPYLLQLKRCFTKIEINDAMKLKSLHAMRILELLLQYLTFGKRKLEIEEMKKLLGIEESEYPFYANLKSRVIERAKTEINAKTSYAVDYDEIKTSRKVTAIEWEIKKKPKSSKLRSLEQEASRSQFLIEALLSYGFSNAIAKRLIQNNEESVIKNALKAVDLQVERGNVKNPKAMLQTAIKDQWHPEIFKTKQKKS